MNCYIVGYICQHHLKKTIILIGFHPVNCSWAKSIFGHYKYIHVYIYINIYTYIYNVDIASPKAFTFLSYFMTLKNWEWIFNDFDEMIVVL